MTQNNLLKRLTPGALNYIKMTIGSRNEADYKKLKKIFRDNRIELKSFADVELDITKFEWRGIEQDRNWWWQLQAMPFLNWYVNSYELQSSEERRDFYFGCIAAVKNWAEKVQENDSPLAWHDHASAFRVRNIVNWMVYCHLQKIDAIKNDSDDVWLSELVQEHLEWLLKDENYSKYTNHGFDQAMISLTIAMMFNGSDLDNYRNVNRKRLEDEIKFAFTEEGVHKENSPGYQKFMLGRLNQLQILKSLGEQDISRLAESYIGNAENFLRAITLPNGYLPMIGDTRGNEKGIIEEHELKEGEYIVYDYSKSGYVIIRGRDGNSKEFYILLKSAHDSNYHRHDDDLMIYLFYDGQVVLGDGGLYKHLEKDEKRIHLRSYLSHSVPYISRKAIRKKESVPRKPSIHRLGNLSFSLESSMFGLTIVRVIELDINSSLLIRINNQVKDNPSEPIWSNFFFENSYPLKMSDTDIYVDFPNYKFMVSWPEKCAINIRKGWAGTEAGYSAIVSKKYGIVEEALSFSLASASTNLTFI